MMTDTLLEQPNNTHRIDDIFNALKSIGDMDVTPLQSESWFDDQYASEQGPEYEIRLDESWLDDLIEAA